MLFRCVLVCFVFHHFIWDSNWKSNIIGHCVWYLNIYVQIEQYLSSSTIYENTGCESSFGRPKATHLANVLILALTWNMEHGSCVCASVSVSISGLLHIYFVLHFSPFSVVLSSFFLLFSMCSSHWNLNVI